MPVGGPEACPALSRAMVLQGTHPKLYLSGWVVFVWQKSTKVRTGIHEPLPDLSCPPICWLTPVSASPHLTLVPGPGIPIR